MGVEAWALKDSEDKKKKLDKKQLADREAKQKEKQAKSKEIRENIKADEALNRMKEMVNDEDLELSLDQVQTIEKIISWDEISEETIKEILEKIDEIEDTEDVDKYLPKESRITWEEYKKALTDDVFRIQIITKLDTALTILANQINPDSSAWLNLFSGYMAVLDKRLIKIQENHIDIKDNLKEVEENRLWKKEDNRSLWQKIIDFIKETLK